MTDGGVQLPRRCWSEMADTATLDLRHLLPVFVDEVGVVIRAAVENDDVTTADTLADDLGSVVGAMLRV